MPLNEWKHFRWQFLLSLQLLYLIVFLFCLHFCILSHFKIIRCIVKSLIATSTFSLLKYNWKKKTWKVFFWVPEFANPNRYTCLPSGLNTSLTWFTFQYNFRNQLLFFISTWFWKNYFLIFSLYLLKAMSLAACSDFLLVLATIFENIIFI